MSDRYEKIRKALPILIAEAQAKGGRNERAALIVELLEERDALRRALSRILENEASDHKAAEEFGGYVLDDELREEARAALAQSEYHERNPKSGEE